MKTHTTLSIETDLLEKARIKHINMSALCEDALIAKLCIDLNKKEAEEAERKIRELLAVARIKEQHDFAKKCISEAFKELTGLEMSDEEFEDYHERFRTAEKGWSIKNYIKEVLKEKDAKQELS